MAAFSRLQLAAALLEYDNDPDTPEFHRSAHDSAIFAPLRRNVGLRPKPEASRSTDYMGVPLPSDTGSMSGRVSAVGSRKSRASINALQGMFGAEPEFEDEGHSEVEEEVEVDLSSWGLDAFIPKDKDSKNARKKGKGRALPNPHSVEGVQTGKVGAAKRPAGVRTRSLGTFDEFGLSEAFIESPSFDKSRRASIGSPLDLAGQPSPSFLHHRDSPHPVIENIPSAAPLHSIPFPTGSVRSASPGPDDHLDNRSQSRLNQYHERNTSVVSPRLMLEEPEMPRHNRTYSTATMGTFTTQLDNPFALDPPTRASKFDPKAAAHARTVSNASFGSRLNPDMYDGASVMTRPQAHRMSTTMDLLRPKVLVMPSPLQNNSQPAPQGPQPREGFVSTTDGAPPLPPGARSTRRLSTNLTGLELSTPYEAPVASNSFTPNPRTNMTASQLLFRNALAVDGQRDVSYADIDSQWPRATEEGEQINVHVDPPEEDKPLEPPEPIPAGRPAGKLYGKSLIDDLENRKAEMKSKQRVFTGDQRPSMMARRSSTLIDPATLQQRPAAQRMSTMGSQNLERRNSSFKPLLNFDEERLPVPGLDPPRPSNVRSVFGVDTLWERETAKLKEIEAAERIEAEKQRQREAELENNTKKGKRKGKNQASETLPSPVVQPPPQPEHIGTTPRLSVDPPVLPAIQKMPRRLPPPANDASSESDSDDDSADQRQPKSHVDTKQWVDESSDEEKEPVRTTGVGARYQKRSQPAHSDSEEDLPLSVSIAHVLNRNTRRPSAANDSDEEKPLSMLIGKPRGNGDDDDDQPLGLRASVAGFGSVSGAGIDDDQPLAFHPEHQRRTQYQMLANQQQQQMMMQAQFHNSMLFAAPQAMMSGYFSPMAPMVAPPMAPMAPISVPSPPPVHDAAKFGRVDQWRHNIIPDGED